MDNLDLTFKQHHATERERYEKYRGYENAKDNKK